MCYYFKVSRKVSFDAEIVTASGSYLEWGSLPDEESVEYDTHFTEWDKDDHIGPFPTIENVREAKALWMDTDEDHLEDIEGISELLGTCAEHTKGE